MFCDLNPREQSYQVLFPPARLPLAPLLSPGDGAWLSGAQKDPLESLSEAWSVCVISVQGDGINHDLLLRTYLQSLLAITYHAVELDGRAPTQIAPVLLRAIKAVPLGNLFVGEQVQDRR